MFSKQNQFIRFLIIGTIITISNFLLYKTIIIYFGISPVLASSLVFLLLIPPHFISYSKLVFTPHTKPMATLARYAGALTISWMVNVVLVWFYWAVLMADPLPAQALTLPIVIATTFLMLKFWVFKEPVASGFRLGWGLPLVSILIASAAGYFAIICIALYTHAIPFGDDWRHFNDYFFVRDTFGSIFGRQNGHLMILPNAAFYSNQVLLDGRMSNIALLSIGALGLFGMIAAKSIDSALKDNGARDDLRLASAIIMLVSPYLLIQPVTQFWGIGLHNHLASLGLATTAYMASGLAGRLERPVVMIGFVAAAVLGSSSFSAGAAAWAMGFVGSIATRTPLRICVIYFVLGLTGGALALGIWTGGPSVGKLPSPGHLASSVAILLGNAPAWLVPSVDLDQRRLIAFSIGAVGLLVAAGAALIHVAQNKTNPYNRMGSGERFFLLLCAGIVLTATLISIGRAQTENATLYPRFATWSAVFQIGMLGLVMLTIHRLSVSLRNYKTIFGLALLLISSFILFVNVQIIDRSIRYVYAGTVRIQTEIAVNTDQRPTISPLWRDRSDVWLKVIKRLKDDKKNIFSESWTSDYGKELPLSMDGSVQECNAQFRLSETKRNDEWVADGWIFGPGIFWDPIATVFFINKKGKVSGFARPVFAPSNLSKNPAYVRSRAIWTGMLQSIPLPLVGELPGLSGAMRGVVKVNLAGENLPPDSLAVVGVTKNGTRCETKI